ncbi:DUF5818 domain-containing protein [Sphingobium sp. V4]|uniref:DUF5818 domain-containing protein n=1 Tax=Sphingobium sp. V4 TaxID=3038927 RepID=UPI002557D142|nr:DUF5818 domain-containing protein [Sphingobium sp. V4]WIW89589.1 DUF5818 domain-containing protein [Sphingobium sp. V4]
MAKNYSEVPVGGRIRVQGRLGQSTRGPVVMDAAGVPLWTLNFDEDCPTAPGKIIIVEGVRVGFDRIDVEWIGEPPSP